MSDLRREAWRRVKSGEPLEPEHVAAQREYNQMRAQEISRPALHADVVRVAERRAKETGVRMGQYIANIVHQEAKGQLIPRAVHDRLLKEAENAKRKAELQNDALREQMLAEAERARAAAAAEREAVEEVLSAWERTITLLDFMGVPEPDGFFPQTAGDMKVDGAPAHG